LRQHTREEGRRRRGESLYRSFGLPSVFPRAAFVIQIVYKETPNIYSIQRNPLLLVLQRNPLQAALEEAAALAEAASSCSSFPCPTPAAA
jgi:hypothetical protein